MCVQTDEKLLGRISLLFEFQYLLFNLKRSGLSGSTFPG